MLVVPIDNVFSALGGDCVASAAKIQGLWWGTPNVRDRDVAYDRKSDGPRTTPAQHKICCIYPKNLRLPPNLKVETIIL